MNLPSVLLMTGPYISPCPYLHSPGPCLTSRHFLHPSPRGLRDTKVPMSVRRHREKVFEVKHPPCTHPYINTRIVGPSTFTQFSGTQIYTCNWFSLLFIYFIHFHVFSLFVCFTSYFVFCINGSPKTIL